MAKRDALRDIRTRSTFEAWQDFFELLKVQMNLPQGETYGQKYYRLNKGRRK